MSRLSTIGLRFQGSYRTITGKTVKGQFLSIPDTSRVTNFISARRYLRTAADTNLVVGDVLIADGVKFIVAEHGTGYFVDSIYKHFKLFEVDSELIHSRRGVVTNPVTGMKQHGAYTVITPILYMSTQPARYIEDRQVGISSDHHIAVCNLQNIDVDDTIGDYVVIKSDKLLGVSILELKSK